VGGGVIGVCCAYFLAKRGARITVLERDQVGKAASYGNAGSIAPGHPPIESGLESAKKETGTISRCGFHPAVVSGEALREREPAINDRVIGGVFYPEAATVNPYQFVMEMAQRAEHHGVKLKTAAGVVALRTVEGHVRGVQAQNGELIEADSVVLAGGA